MFNDRQYIFSFAMITLLAGCAVAPSQITVLPTAQPATAPAAQVAPRDERRPTQSANPSVAARAAADRALSDLAQDLGVSPAMIEVLGVQPRYGASTKSDSTGPPDGWNIRLGVGEDVYLYQVDARGALKRVLVRR